VSKNIVICLDGTGNEIEADISNVLKLYRSLKKKNDQAVYYSQGVGTLVSVRRWSQLRQAVTDKLLGKMIGYGLDDRVIGAYEFIVKNYDPDDQLFIFGYSRGAYTARVLAGMIHAVGIIKRNQYNLIGAAYAAYLSEPKTPATSTKEAIDKAQLSMRDFKAKESKAQNFRRITQSRSVPISFLGLFDTVGSVFARNFGQKSILPLTRDPYPHTFLNPSVKYVCHAVSIDEKRQMFPVSLWPDEQLYFSNPFNPKPVPQTSQEVWFAGGHGDVGGGNPQDQSGLSQIPLIWMASHARLEGLKFYERTFRHVSGQKKYSANTDHVYPKPDPLAKLHKPSWWKWGYFEIDLFRSPKVLRLASQKGRWHFPLFRPRPVPNGVKIHETVFKRIDADSAYRPKNIPDKYAVVSDRS
jgi:uncharacterized protein (DUF2235 family)